MRKAKTPSFVVTRRMRPDQGQVKQLESMFSLVNSAYNSVLAEALRRWTALADDAWYVRSREEHIKWNILKGHLEKDVEDLKETFSDKQALKTTSGQLKQVTRTATEWKKERDACAQEYGFSEYALHEYAGILKRTKYNNKIGINIMQKTATEAWQAIQKVAYGNGKRVHFRKYGQTRSFEDKAPDSGIIYHAAKTVKKREYEHVTVQGVIIRLKPVTGAIC